MPNEQAELTLSAPRPGDAENEQDREERLLARLRRPIEDACDEIGRKAVCYALQISEQLLSKQLSGAEGKEPRYSLLLFCLKHERSDRLARAVAEYTGHLRFQRPVAIDPDEAMREVVALALAGEFSNAGREKVLALYARMNGGAR